MEIIAIKGPEGLEPRLPEWNPGSLPPMGLKTYEAMSMKTNASLAQKRITHIQYATTTLVTIDMQSKARTWKIL